MIGEHLPALQVVVPLVAAPLIVLARRGAAAWLIATIASFVSLAIALALFVEVREAGVVSYALGSWAPPWGIEYRIDAANSVVLVLVALLASFVAPYAWRSAAFEVPEDQHYLCYAMFCLCLAGLLGIAITGDAFNLFVFLEISSLSSYVLIALGRDRRALLSAYQYLIVGTIGATFYVIGVGLLYLETGTLNIADLAARVAEVGTERPVLAALAFITVGLSLKLALFPLHFWLPNAYAYAPSIVSAFLAGTATKVSIYALLRFYFSVFGAHELFEVLPMGAILLALSVAAMMLASLGAVFQDNLKHMLAYSSVGQIGYITFGISLANQPALTGSVVHLVNHGVTKTALFLLAGAVAFRVRSVRFERLGGLARAMPLTCAGIVAGGFSLIGVPGTAGFVSKWYFVLGALEAGSWSMAFLPVVSSLIALWYMWRFVEVAYFRAPGPALAGVKEAPPALLVPSLALIAVTVFFGLDAPLTVGAAAQAAQVLLGGIR
ncbi:MAG: monovalent cation/H+ antiporter subunit D family protein [Burkholderiales bacterium]|nr:monovalent cation/H+ antiporter subunit D family protein [Burkholderiales bacterium]